MRRRSRTVCSILTGIKQRIITNIQFFGFFCGARSYNSRGFDLNRNFPDYFKQNTKREQPETDAVKEWISKIQFVLSGSLHGGALVASYPYDNTPNSSKYQFQYFELIMSSS